MLKLHVFSTRPAWPKESKMKWIFHTCMSFFIIPQAILLSKLCVVCDFVQALEFIAWRSTINMNATRARPIDNIASSTPKKSWAKKLKFPGKMSRMCWQLHLAVQWHFHCISISWFFELAFIILFCISEVLSSEAFCCARNAFHSLWIASAASAQFLELKTHNASIDSLSVYFFAFLHALVFFFFFGWTQMARAYASAPPQCTAMRLLHSSMGHIAHDFSNKWSPRARADFTLIFLFFAAVSVCLCLSYNIPSVRWRESDKVK